MKKQNKFQIFLTISVQSIANRISKDMKISYKDANSMIYNSNLYKDMQKEESKMWYFSSKDLADILKKEYNSGV